MAGHGFVCAPNLYPILQCSQCDDYIIYGAGKKEQYMDHDVNLHHKFNITNPTLPAIPEWSDGGLGGTTHPSL